MTQHLSIQIRAHAEAPSSNLARLMDGLARGLQMPVKVDGTDAVGFVVRLDDGPFGPVAAVHLQSRVLYRDPEELELLSSTSDFRVS